MTRKNGPGDFTVEVSPKKPKTTVIVPETKRQTIKISERGVAGPQGPKGAFVISETPPTNPVLGDVWYNSQTGRMYIYYDSFWVESAGNVGPTGPAAPGSGLFTGNGAPITEIGTNGGMYLDISSGLFYGPKANDQWPSEPLTSTTNTARFVYNQPVAATTWEITHTLGGRPSVTIVDSAGTVVVGEVVYNSDTSITVLFSAPFSGQAYLT